MSLIIHHFLHSARWSALESVGYHTLLALHQFFLFRVVSPTFYGQMGTYFSLIYLCVALVDLGMEASMSAFVSHWTRTKQEARSFLAISIMPTLIMWAIIAVGAFFIARRSDITSLTCILLGALSFTESIKRPLKTANQLIFNSHLVAIIEISTILFYMVVIWSLYALDKSLTISALFVPLFMVSLASTASLGYAMWRYYEELPQSSESASLSWKLIAKNRLFAALAQLSILPFSSNFLVPLFAYQFGMVSAGMLKLASNLVHNGAAVIQKIAGASGRVGLAHARSLDLIAKQKLFFLMTALLYQALYALLIFCVINHQLMFDFCRATDSASAAVLSLFFLILCADTVIVTYEKLFETHERVGTLCAVYAMGCILVALLVLGVRIASPVVTLLCIALVRLSTCALLSGMSLRMWQLRSSYALQPAVLLVATIVSLAVKFICS